MPAMKQAFAPGHFYSPIVDAEALHSRRDVLWPASAPKIIGIDFKEANQRIFVESDMKRARASFDYTDAEGDPDRYHLNNGLFGGHDALALVAMLQKYRPKRIIEIGSGYSSLLIANELARDPRHGTEFLCVDPFPRPFIRELQKNSGAIPRLHAEKVEELPVSFFSGLAANDVLFIDSSHVAKTGSDVNFLFLEVLPRLAPGVVIHIHDIFLPRDYPADWVLDLGFCWNEQYLLRALLMHSTAFEVLFGSAYAELAFPDLLRMAWVRDVSGGSSFWMRRN
jgi:predicted O-methyltransferase YrrM